MKIKLSKNQWENIGIKAGWIKTSQYDTQYRVVIFPLKETGRYTSHIKAIPEDKTLCGLASFSTPSGGIYDFNNVDCNICRQKYFKKNPTLRTAQVTPPPSEFSEFMDALDPDNSAKIKPVIYMIVQDNVLKPEREFDRKKLDQILGKHEFNSWPDTIKSIEKKLWFGPECPEWFGEKQSFDTPTSGYTLFVNGMPVLKYLETKERSERFAKIKSKYLNFTLK